MSRARKRATQYDAIEQRYISVTEAIRLRGFRVLKLMQKPCGESFVSIVDDDPGNLPGSESPDAIRPFGCGDVFSAEEFLESGKLAQTACLDAITKNEWSRIAKALASTGDRVPLIIHRPTTRWRRRRHHSVGRGCNSCLVQASLRAKRRGRAAVSHPLDTSVRHEKVRNRPSAPLTLGFRALAFLDDPLMPSLWLPCDPQSALFPGRRLPRQLDG
jgi:hypothetical protein